MNCVAHEWHATKKSYNEFCCLRMSYVCRIFWVFTEHLPWSLAKLFGNASFLKHVKAHGYVRVLPLIKNRKSYSNLKHCIYTQNFPLFPNIKLCTRWASIWHVFAVCVRSIIPTHFGVNFSQKQLNLWSVRVMFFDWKCFWRLKSAVRRVGFLSWNCHK